MDYVWITVDSIIHMDYASSTWINRDVGFAAGGIGRMRTIFGVDGSVVAEGSTKALAEADVVSERVPVRDAGVSPKGISLRKVQAERSGGREHSESSGPRPSAVSSKSTYRYRDPEKRRKQVAAAARRYRERKRREKE